VCNCVDAYLLLSIFYSFRKFSVKFSCFERLKSLSLVPRGIGLLELMNPEIEKTLLEDPTYQD
jgi:hypothetical protein